MKLDQLKLQYNYDDATSVMKQYLDIKFDHMDCLLLFRMGDFYELFYEDAITASRILGLALTKRNKDNKASIAMCGVPHHALENYLNKLLNDGFKVAICDQVETPEEAKKLRGYKAIVSREVKQIITPGTIVADALLTQGIPNYLVSIVIEKDQAAICAIDLSTSEITLLLIPKSHIINELVRLQPKEILLSDEYRSSDFVSSIAHLDTRISFRVPAIYSTARCIKNILAFYKINSLAAIGELNKVQISALGSMIEYIELTQKEFIPKLPFPKILNSNNFMNIDASTRRSLEITSLQSGGIKGSLFSHIDSTVTKSGSRLLYNYLSSPLIKLQDIEKRLDITTFFFNNIELTEEIRKELHGTADLERCITRLNSKRSTPRDLLSIKNVINTAEKIGSFFMNYREELPENVNKIIKNLVGNTEIAIIIASAIRDDAPNNISQAGIIKPQYHQKVSDLYKLINNSQNAVDALCSKYKTETKIDSLKINQNNVLGMFIDITSRHADKIKDAKFIHRQTTINSVRYSTEELQELETQIVNAHSSVVQLEQELYQNICDQVLKVESELVLLGTAISLIDLYCNFAKIADEKNHTRPILSDGIEFEITGGRHPIVENSIATNSAEEIFVSNDCNLSMNQRILLITGPNMSGKSTYLRQNALIAILGQIGAYVPAKKAKIGIVDNLFSRIGSGDNLSKGQSTFMVEMLETAAILNQATNKSLVILDEVGRGTSTYDGVSIAWSVLEHLHDKIKTRCLFATHYHELTEMEKIFPALKNYTIKIEENKNEIIFLYNIIKGASDRSYGVHVAKIAGLPPPVIKKANQLLAKFETNSNNISKKNIANESSNMSLFEMHINNDSDQKNDQDIMKIIKEKDAISAKLSQLENKLLSIDVDKLTPMDALIMLSKIRESCNEQSE